jgi:hypothetical protein
MSSSAIEVKRTIVISFTADEMRLLEDSFPKVLAVTGVEMSLEEFIRASAIAGVRALTRPR